MKLVGLLGGTSWHSSADYYRMLNEQVNQKLGKLHSADLLLRSVDFQWHHERQQQDQWDMLAREFTKNAQALEKAGAQGIVICANTMHLMAEDIQNQIDIPILHIADAIAIEAKRFQTNTLGVIGTAYTMEKPFYREALEQRDIQMLVPDESGRKEIHRVIYEELCNGKIESSSQQTYLQLIQSLEDNGAGAVVLGCTEIGLLVQQALTPVKLIDSLKAHVDYVVDWMIAD
ncbi:aspartate/glutamate racemase family protein [Pleionea sp. CnH1-48]|uniref:aspartate/glutamate racemase family protein n=1 Tax=Pleionea sp. CnH1-48 TaxID=2954494 RepID=UPI0020970CA1|nr:amino acid racemase [Pleionea sp. CnH1-48]MCO7225700.1 amino acid racemase [Pleionea sp. CnH1-48]